MQQTNPYRQVYAESPVFTGFFYFWLMDFGVFSSSLDIARGGEDLRYWREFCCF